MHPNLLLVGAACLPATLGSVVATRASPRADIRADTNRDGTVDLEGDSDVKGKQQWTASSGAVFLPNIGDTDRRCSKKALSGPALSNEALDDCNDASDNIQRAPQFLAPLKTVPLRGLAANAVGTVSVSDQTARDNVRIFRSDTGKWIFTDNDFQFSKEALEAGLELGIDARDTRRPDGWDGKVTVTFTVRGDNTNSTDQVALRVAPVLMHHHLQPVEQVLAVAGNATDAPFINQFTQDLSAAVKGAGINQNVYLFNASDDIWVQDFVEPGYASMPGPSGPVSIRVMIRCPQDSRVAGRQLFEYFRKDGVGAVQHLGGARDEINSGGNIETVPPHSFNGKDWPAGRVILGTHGEQKHHILPYLQAQETQDPILLDTDWLSIGHVDEFLQFLPADNARGWVVMVDDPLAGLAMLKDLEAKGHGSVAAISRPNDTDTQPPKGCQSFFCEPVPVKSTTIAQALSDSAFVSLNQQCAERIENNIAILKREVGLADAEILRLPTLFENSPFGEVPEGKLKVSAFYPGVVNNLVLTGTKTCVAPRPWGPTPLNGTDVLAEAIRAQYAKIGV
ncbi:arginine deiminase type-3 [Apiospora arundinis]|uniref:Arginine deiminase type-3 n=1 Tax=Apiospora arundinis TaxID=335852 RepID=A0ABR2JMF6_9PEZI